jgi:D-alanyl-D-alanine dipeptidase
MTYHLPKSFCYLETIDDRILQDIAYAGPDNLMGRPLLGYVAPRCIVSEPLGLALKKVQDKALAQGFLLKIYEAHRPLRAAEDFIAWSRDLSDSATKEDYYPRINKADFFDLGYVALRSSHSRGAAVDLTLVPLDSPTKTPLDMGTRFDFMDVLSHSKNTDIPLEAQENRRLLRDLMESHGFEHYEKEWWHFTLKNEPFRHTYFDFPVG